MGRLLEIGAGTGEIGVHLARALGHAYVGLDRSAAMLDVFRGRAGQRVSLVVADANAAWPLSAGVLDGVLMSRVSHLIERAHLAHQLTRALRHGGVVLLGRRERGHDNVRAVLRRELRARLRERGYAPKGGGREAGRLCEAHGHHARAEPSVVAAEWKVSHAPIDALAAWRSKSGLSGLDLSHGDKRELLEAVERFAKATYGDLQRAHPGHERYVIDVLRLV